MLWLDTVQSTDYIDNMLMYISIVSCNITDHITSMIIFMTASLQALKKRITISPSFWAPIMIPKVMQNVMMPSTLMPSLYRPSCNATESHHFSMKTKAMYGIKARCDHQRSVCMLFRSILSTKDFIYTRTI